MYLIILGVYDKGISEKNLEKLEKKIKKAGYKQDELLLKNIPTDKKVHHNQKFKFLLKTLEEEGYHPFPIFYLHSALNNSEKGDGVISELLDIVDHFPHLVNKTTILKHPTVKTVEQVDCFHHRDVFKIKSVNEGAKEAINHLEGHFRLLNYYSSKPQSLNKSEPVKKSKEVFIWLVNGMKKLIQK